MNIFSRIFCRTKKPAAGPGSPNRLVTLHDLEEVAGRLMWRLAQIEKANQMTEQELIAQLAALKLQIGKVAQEQSTRFDTLTTTIANLTTQINSGEVKPEVAAALADVQTALQALDDTIPDAPPAPAAPPA